MASHRDARYALASNVLLALGLIDLLRGVLHTYTIRWAVATFAQVRAAEGAEQHELIFSSLGQVQMILRELHGRAADQDVNRSGQ